MVIHAYASGLSGVHATNPNLKLGVGRDAAMGDEQVLLVEYPAPGDDPAGRDVDLEAENRDWTRGRAIAFQIKPTNAIRFSVSFLDRNRVAYTAWRTLQADVWQSVRIPFDEIRPNPYFQPPGAKTGVPIDVSEVNGIAFAPQDQASGHLSISQIVLVK